MRRLLPTFLFFIVLCQCAQAQHFVRIMEWNVENLFDCRHDSLKQDEEFMPESPRQWTWGRYWRKISDVSRVVMAVGENQPPALVGLCEIENDSVMIALTQRGPLRALGYRYVMTTSPDARGIDCALMYQPSSFRLLGYESHRVHSVECGLRPTRDILHAWGIVEGLDTLHVIVCHLPSRAGGSREGKRNRMLAAQTLTAITDSLLYHAPDCHLLVMGDFNATLRDKALKPLRTSCGLTPLTPDKKRPTSGTYRYQGNWSWIDHIMVSPSLSAYVNGEAHLYTQTWLQRPSSDGTWYPRRTYMGTTYNGGVSDHVPIYIDLKFQ